MRTYECTILLNPALANADFEGALATVRGLYEQEGAEWIELEKWEERRLAYKIADQTSAVFLFGYFRSESDAIDRIERRCRLNDMVIRQLIIARDGKSYDAIRAQREKRKAEAAAAAVGRE